MKKILVFLGAAVLAARVYAAGFPDITIPELKSVMESKKAVTLDVNGSESYQQGHIPGAIDYIANQDKIISLLPKDKNALVVAYCGNPQCQAYLSAAKAVKKLGYTNVKHLTAGIAGWKEAHEKTEKGG